MYLTISNETIQKATNIMESIEKTDWNEFLIDPYQWNKKYSIGLNVEIFYGTEKLCVVSDELPGWVIKVDCDPGEGRCMVESNNYEAAVKRGLQKFFACTAGPFYTSNHTEFYCQEKLRVDECGISSIIEDQSNSQNCSGEYDISYDDEMGLLNLYGEDELYIELLEFISDSRINDLHESNYGYRPNGEVAILDFCGYWDGYSSEESDE